VRKLLKHYTFVLRFSCALRKTAFQKATALILHQSAVNQVPLTIFDFDMMEIKKKWYTSDSNFSTVHL